MRAYLQRLIAWIKGALAQLRLFKFPNATIFGQPTIQDGQVSNFSATNYLQFPFLVDFAGRPWQIDCAFTTGADVSQQHNIFDSAFGLAFAFANGHFVMALSTNGTTWDLGAPEGTHRITLNTTYYVRIAWDGSQYTLSFSIDKETYTTDIVVNSSVTLAPKQIVIGKSILNPSAIFNGSINMNHAMLTISGKVVWQGMDDAGLATRLAIDLSNIDAAGMKKVNDVAMAGEVGQKLNDLSSQLDDKLSIGGRDDSARVGFANNLIGVPYREENAEFFYRKTGGLAEVVDGSATIKSIKGNSVVEDGRIINMNIAKYKSAGRNLWDEEWNNGYWGDNGEFVSRNDIICSNGYIKVTPSILYLRKPSVPIYICQYDSHKTFISRTRVNGTNLTLTPNTSFITFNFLADYGAKYNHDVCINVSDPSFNGQYEPYKEFVRELPDDSVFFDDVLPSGKVVKGMKGAGNAFDERTEKQRIKRIGVLENLGELQWNYDASRKIFYAISNWLYENISSTNIIDSIGHNGADWADTPRKTNCITIGWYLVKGIHISDYRYSDAASFKAAMQGVLLYYELAEPIVEDVEAANLSVNVWHNGTEEAIAKDGTPSTPLKATIDYDLDYPAQVKSLMQLHTETAALLQQLQS